MAASPSSNIAFGPGLAAPEASCLRQKLTNLFESTELTISIETFFGWIRRLDDGAYDGGHEYFVIFDHQRTIVFRASGGRDDPRLPDLLHHLADGYPLQPFRDFLLADSDYAYQFQFHPVMLELLPAVLAELPAGQYAVLNLLTGEISPALLTRHPRARSSPIVKAQPERPVESPLRSVTTDRTLRVSLPPPAADLVDRNAGLMRWEILRENSASLAHARTAIALGRGSRQEFCEGIATTALEAQAIARCEAIERYQIAKQPPGIELIRARYVDISDVAIDPRKLFLGRSPLCPDDEGSPFDPTELLSWTWAWGPSARQWRLVPAQEVWYDTPELMNEKRLSYTTTSGCALGTTLEESATFGAFEAIERDGLLTSWYLLRPAQELDLSSCSERLQDLLDRCTISYSDYRFFLVDLTSDVGVPTVGGYAIRQNDTAPGPKVVCSAATHVDPERACFSALKELTRFRPDESLSSADYAAADVPPNPQGHFDFFASDVNFDMLGHLGLGRRRPIPINELRRNSPILESDEFRLDCLLETLARHLESVGASLFIVDVTHPEFAERGFRVARVLTPGLFPLWFGGRSRRFAVTDRLKRLAHLYTGQPFDASRLQLAPHPMT